MHIKRAIVVSMRHVAWRGKIVKCDPITSNMPYGNGCTPHNMHARDLVYISKYCHCQYESIDVYSMYIVGLVAVSMVHVYGILVPFIDFAPSGSMHHGNNYGPLNMHAIDMVCILIDSQ